VELGAYLLCGSRRWPAPPLPAQEACLQPSQSKRLGDDSSRSTYAEAWVGLSKSGHQVERTILYRSRLPNTDPAKMNKGYGVPWRLKRPGHKVKARLRGNRGEQGVSRGVEPIEARSSEEARKEAEMKVPARLRVLPSDVVILTPRLL